MRNGWQPWASTMATNLAIAVIVATLTWFIGIKAFLLVHLPITLLAATAGVWLFYVQHQFEHTTWERDERWNLHQAALHGSSHYELPALLRWFTANIGIHHVHHLCSRIPYYRLPRVLRDYPELRDVGHITLLQSFQCVPAGVVGRGAAPPGVVPGNLSPGLRVGSRGHGFSPPKPSWPPFQNDRILGSRPDRDLRSHFDHPSRRDLEIVGGIVGRPAHGDEQMVLP